MLRLRLGAIVPPGGVNLAYITVPPAVPQTHLALSDYSVDIPENVANTFGSDDEVDITTETAETDEFVLSNRSVFSRNVRRPTPLFYAQALSFPVVDQEASAAALPAAREILRKHLTILDGANRVTTNLDWDIGIPTVGPAPNTFLVTIFTDRLPSRGQSFKVRYNAWISGAASPNFRQVLNPTPILTAGTDFTLTDGGAAGFTISGLAVADFAPALGLFLDTGGPASVTVTATDLDFGGGATVGLLTSGVYRPVKDVVADVNALNVNVLAVALSNSDRAELATGVFALATTGTVLRFLRQTHLRYTDLFRIQPLLPLSNTPKEPWYPRVSRGAFCVFKGGRTLRYEVRDFEYQAFSTRAGRPYKEAVLEDPTPIDPSRVQLSKRPVRLASDVQVFVDGLPNNSLVDQVDLNNGILFLTRAIGPNTSMQVSYLYESQAFVYRGVNLNPTLKQNPDLLGKFVGVFMIPYKIFDGATTETFERTVFHVIRDTAQAIVDLLPTLTLSDGSSAEALLLGIYHVIQTEVPEDLQVIDTRTPGGGLLEALSATDVAQDEAGFYADKGGHFDGEPYPDAGTLILEAPLSILGSGQVDDRETLYDSIAGTAEIDPSAYMNPDGALTTEEAVARVRKHVDAGAFVIEDFYVE